MPAAVRSARRLTVEPLEDRTTPATIPVTTLADGGPGSLRAAIDAANAAPDPDTIVFAGAAVGGVISLTTFTNLTASSAAVPQPAGPSAFLITSPITIQGTGETVTRTGAAPFRLFQVTAAGNLTLQNLILSNGLAQGGAGGGGGAGLGGAVYNQGALTILGCTLTGNQAVGGAGGALAGGGGLGGPGAVTGGPPNGGGIAAAGGFGGGGGTSGAGVGGDGGFGGGGGGGSTNFTGDGGFGGGGGGTSGAGVGGVGGFGGGGGITVGGGGAGMGGAVFNQGGALVITNTTIAGNTARGGSTTGFAQTGSGIGGGVFNLNGSVTLTHVTIAGNTVAAGAGSALVGGAAGGAVYNLSLNVGTVTPTQIATVVVANSILANTTGGVLSDVVNNQPTGTATITATGPNVVSVNPITTLSGTPVTVANPNLGPLTNNGGFTPTMIPASPLVIDHGSNSAAAGLTTDQRGGNFVRVFNGVVDLGAVEVQPPPPPLPPPLPPPRPLVVGGLPNGSAAVFVPDAAGAYPAAPAATVSPFGALGANVRTATGDVNGDRFADLILVTGPGGPARFAVVSGADHTTLLVPPTDVFEGFTGGAFVAAGDFDRDGRAEFVVTPDRGGGPRVSIFGLLPTGLVRQANYFTVDPDFRGGARAAVGDVNGDSVPDLAVAAGFGGGPRVALIDGTKALATDGFNPADRLIGDFFAFPDALRNGVYVAIGDVDGDGFGDLIFGAGPGGGPQVLTVSGQALLAQGAVAAVAAPLSNFFVANTDSDRGGVRVAVTDADGDARADVAVGTGEGRPSRVRVYLGKNFGGGEPAQFQDLDPFAGAVLADGIFVG